LANRFGVHRRQLRRARDGWRYELVVFDLPRHQELIDHGEERTFEDAKAAAERAFDKL
jgi:hypothetical protein